MNAHSCIYAEAIELLHVPWTVKALLPLPHIFLFSLLCTPFCVLFDVNFTVAVVIVCVGRVTRYFVRLSCRLSKELSILRTAFCTGHFPPRLHAHVFSKPTNPIVAQRYIMSTSLHTL